VPAFQALGTFVPAFKAPGTTIDFAGARWHLCASFPTPGPYFGRKCHEAFFCQMSIHLALTKWAFQAQKHARHMNLHPSHLPLTHAFPGACCPCVAAQQESCQPSACPPRCASWSLTGALRKPSTRQTCCTGSTAPMRREWRG